MAYLITDSCINCGLCVDSCPSACIAEGQDKYAIDPAACTDCGACADACPAGAIEKA